MAGARRAARGRSVGRLTPGLHLIELSGLGKRYGEVVAVEGLSLSVERGELLMLVGGSGSGKTTTLKMINRVVEPFLAGLPPA